MSPWNSVTERIRAEHATQHRTHKTRKTRRTRKLLPKHASMAEPESS
jgi:hypothetical protein